MRLLLLLALLIGWKSDGATYFTDYVSGNDASVGTSSDAAWQHCPGDSRATGNAAITLTAGDTVVFKGGVSYGFAGDNLDVNASGTAGNLITLKSGHRNSPQWGTTPAIIDGANAGIGSDVGVLNIGTQSYVLIDGFVVVNGTNRNDYTANVAWKGNSGGNVTIANCTITNGGGDGIVIQGLWNAGAYPGPFTVTNCLIHDLNAHCILLRAGLRDVTVTNCTFYRAGIEIITGVHLGDAVFMSQGGTCIQSNVVLAGNSSREMPTKGDYIFACDMEKVRVFGNYLWGTNLVFSIATSRCITNLWIYNNVFDKYVSQYEGVIRFLTDEGNNSICDGVKIWNNTILGELENGAIIHMVKGNSTLATLFYNVDIRNNIILNTNSDQLIFVGANNGGTGPVVDAATFTCDYNNYFGGPANQFTWNGTSTDLAGWKTATGQDANSITTDPNLDASYKLQAARAGADLSASFTTDKDGVTRTVPWDIGAYEYVAPGPVTLRANNLRVIGTVSTK